MTGEYDWLWWIVATILVIGVLVVWWVLRKGRPFAAGDVFRASRLSRGNHFFPAQVAINPTSVVQYTPQWFGREELTIHMAHVASVNIKTGLLLSDVFIETSGGSDPIACHGHRKKDAVRIKELIEGYQTAYYKSESAQRALKNEQGKGAEPKG